MAALLALLAMLVLPAPVYAGGNTSVTRQFSPSANAAVAGQGNGDGFETTAGNAYTDGGGYAIDTNSGSGNNTAPLNTGADKHNFYTYGFSSVIPSGSTIGGITVRADIAVDSTNQGPYTAIRLSWDAGTNWTTIDASKQVTLTAITETTYTYGSSSDTWGRTWSTSELSDANFRLQAINGDTNAGANQRDFSLDWVAVSITYTAPWDSHTDSAAADPAEDTFGAPNYYVYMKNATGGSFPNGTYKVTFYDAGGAYVDRETGISVTAGTLKTTGLYLGDKTGATAGPGWHAVVQPSTASDPNPNNYANLTSAPDTYQLSADDTFEVQLSAIPEFPTIIAAVVTLALCAFIYREMRKRHPLYV